MNNSADSFSKELNSIASHPHAKQNNSQNEEEEFEQLPLKLNKMVSDHIQLSKKPPSRGSIANNQKLFYAKSMNYDPSGSSFYQDQDSTNTNLNDSSTNKERSNRSVVMHESTSQYHSGGGHHDKSFSQQYSYQSSRKYSNYAHQNVSEKSKYHASSFSQQSKKPTLKVFNIQNDEMSNSSIAKDHSKSRQRKISFAGKEDLMGMDSTKKAAFIFPPPAPSGGGSRANKQVFAKQDSLSIDRAPTASTRPFTTAQNTRQYFKFGDSKGFVNTPNHNHSIDTVAQQNMFSNSFISDKNDFSHIRPSTTNAVTRSRMQKRDPKSAFSLISQLNSTCKSKQTNEPRNQYDLDKTFLNVFTQSQFSHGESNNHSTRFISSKQGNRQERKSVTSIYSKRGSIFGHHDIQNLSPNMTATNFQSPNQSILKKKQNKNAVNQQISPKSIKYDLDDIINEKENNYKKQIEQSLKDIEDDNYRSIFLSLKELLSKSVDINDLKLFCSVVEFMADLALEMQDINAATFLYDQMRTLCTYTNNHQKKAKTLLQLAKCARFINYYQEAIILLKKSLQYAWFSKENDIELEIYDEFGRNYHYQGNIEKALYYHERFMNGEYEDDQSPTKSFSEENINTFLKTIQFIFTDVTSLLLAYLKIPILSLSEMPQVGNVNQTNYISGKTPRVNANLYNQMYFDKCEGKDIIAKILQGDEFYIQIQSPKFSVKVEEMELGVLAKKRIDKMMFRQRHVIYDNSKLGKIDLDSKSRDFTNPFKYKVSLDKKIEYLKKQKLDTDIDSKLEKVRQARTQRSEESMRNRVFNNSLYKHPKYQTSQRKPITNNYKNMYKTFIVDFLEKSNQSLLDITS